MEAIDRLVRLGFIISGLIAVLIVVSVIFISIIAVIYDPTIKIPSVLENWGGVVVGFSFGTFISLIKDYMRLNDDKGKLEPAPGKTADESNKGEA